MAALLAEQETGEFGAELLRLVQRENAATGLQEARNAGMCGSLRRLSSLVPVRQPVVFT